jgi:hypothetical protein
MGKKSRETVLEKYSMKRCAELFADVVIKTVEANRKDKS